MSHTIRLRDRDEEELRRAEHRHAQHIRDRVKQREYERMLQSKRGYLYDDGDDSDDA